MPSCAPCYCANCAPLVSGQLHSRVRVRVKFSRGSYTAGVRVKFSQGSYTAGVRVKFSRESYTAGALSPGDMENSYVQNLPQIGVGGSVMGGLLST